MTCAPNLTVTQSAHTFIVQSIQHQCKLFEEVCVVLGTAITNSNEHSTVSHVRSAKEKDNGEKSPVNTND